MKIGWASLIADIEDAQAYHSVLHYHSQADWRQVMLAVTETTINIIIIIIYFAHKTGLMYQCHHHTQLCLQGHIQLSVVTNWPFLLAYGRTEAVLYSLERCKGTFTRTVRNWHAKKHSQCCINIGKCWCRPKLFRWQFHARSDRIKIWYNLLTVRRNNIVSQLKTLVCESHVKITRIPWHQFGRTLRDCIDIQIV